MSRLVMTKEDVNFIVQLTVSENDDGDEFTVTTREVVGLAYVETASFEEFGPAKRHFQVSCKHWLLEEVRKPLEPEPDAYAKNPKYGRF